MANRASPVADVQLTSRQIQLISRAICDPRRFEIFRQIGQKGCVACTILREEMPISPATLSHHLKELERAGLIEATRDGKYMNLQIQRSVWRAYLSKLQEI